MSSIILRPRSVKLKTMLVLVVDDEPLAQTALANILSTRNDVDEFDFANDAIEALEKLGKRSYDVLLLDINMPEVSGIELLDRLQRSQREIPSIIFVTAHAEHAIAAFGKHVDDYVLKPFSRARIDEALDVAFRRSAADRAARLMETLPQLQRLMTPTSPRIAIKANGRILFVEPGEVSAVHAEGNYVLLQCETGSYLLRESISAMTEKLKPYGFIRIHRSVLVNAACVEEVKPRTTGEYGLRLRGGGEYTVSRTYRGNLKKIATSWIGTEGMVEH
jgi:two-component system, LytTR family, response regulator